MLQTYPEHPGSSAISHKAAAPDEHLSRARRHLKLSPGSPLCSTLSAIHGCTYRHSQAQSSPGRTPAGTETLKSTLFLRSLHPRGCHTQVGPNGDSQAAVPLGLGKPSQSWLWIGLTDHRGRPCPLSKVAGHPLPRPSTKVICISRTQA